MDGAAGRVRAMPNIRTMTIVAETAVLTEGQDPSTSKAITIVKDLLTFAPTTCTVDLLTTLTLTSSSGNQRNFVGTVDGGTYQVTTTGYGVGMTAVIAS